MTNITEDYVSFETAKLLKEKGFDENCSHSYVKDKLAVSQGFNNSYYTTMYSDDCYRPISAPTLQMVMKWLREVHKIAIILHYDREKFGWWSSVLPMDLDCDDELDQMALSFDCFEKDYEEACEAAIKYCLENLV